MRLAWLTDIHVNFVKPPVLAEFLDDLVSAGPDAVLITGDIGEAHSCAGYLKAMGAKLARPVYFVLGNHDLYMGSFASVRESMRNLVKSTQNLTWLTESGVVELGARSALVGHDTWADARLGDFTHTPVMLNDFLLIEDLKLKPPEVIRATMEQAADAGAAHLRKLLPAALASHAHVICAVHVPPFAEATWHEGKHSDKDWLPFFACKASGEAILEAAKRFPEKKITVLCGHTHGAGEYSPLPNVTVLTGGAEYGKPAIQRTFDLS
ncbi:MAG: metallophosphoesterase family protein [Planctomycetes bacterium]|nr:metallophosphoesterase family protein [Planctomycetota bacterium]